MWPDNMFRNQLGNKTMGKRGWWGGWVALKVGAAQLRWVTDFSEASCLEGEHGDFSSRGHLRCQWEYSTLACYTNTCLHKYRRSSGWYICTGADNIVIKCPWNKRTVDPGAVVCVICHEMHRHIFCFITLNYICTSFYCRWVLNRPVAAEEFLEDCRTDICKINKPE